MRTETASSFLLVVGSLMFLGGLIALLNYPLPLG